MEDEFELFDERFKIHSSEQLEMILPARIIPYLFTDLECIHFSHIYPLRIQTVI